MPSVISIYLYIYIAIYIEVCISFCIILRSGERVTYWICHDGYVGGVVTKKTKFGGEIWIMFNTKAIAAGSNFCSCGSLLHRNQQAMRPL